MPNLRLFSYSFSEFNFDLPVIEISNADTYTKTKLLYPNGFIPISPANAGIVFGIQWWLKLITDHKTSSILDCGDTSYQALMALDAGIGAVKCSSLQSIESNLEVKEILANSSPASSKL